MSQGQRFRRRALRRGYKVDEVDSFLDRVEATIAGDSVGAPVSAQEVHDVVFRVRFGGYDEWQVDLHLDRVERQLSELEERGGFARGGMEPPRPEMRSGEMRMAPPDRMAPDRMMPERLPPDRVGPDRIAPDRMPMGGPPDRMGPPGRMPAPMEPRMAPPPMAPPLPSRPSAMPVQAGPPPGPYNNRYDEPTYGGAFDDNGGYEPSRHVRGDMTTELRMDPREMDRPGMGGPGMGGPGMDRPGMGGPGMGSGMDRPGMGGRMGGMPEPATYGGGMGDPYGPPGGPGGPGAAPPTEVARIDQLRRTFQLRRFGSGYDRNQVDRLFEGVMASLSGRGGQLNDGDLDPSKFDLVSGGYFEAEVDAALKEVRDIVMRRR